MSQVGDTVHTKRRDVILVTTGALAGWLMEQTERSALLGEFDVSGVVLTDEAGTVESDIPVFGRVRHLETILRAKSPARGVACVPRALSRVRASVEHAFRSASVEFVWAETFDDSLASGDGGARSEDSYAHLLGRDSHARKDGTQLSVVHGKRVLITGAGGSIGSELARQCAQAGVSSLLIMERSERALFEIDQELTRAGCTNVQAVLHDVVDAEGTREWFERFAPDLIFHAAAHKHVPLMEDHPHEALRNNVLGTVSVTDAAVACEAKRMVLISTDKAVHPTSVMGATKRIAELYVRSRNTIGTAGTKCSMVRFGNVLGSSGSVLEVWKRQIADGGPVTVTDPRMTRYFMTIPEAAGLVIRSADLSTDGGGVFVLDMGEPARIVDLAASYCRSVGLAPQFSAHPMLPSDIQSGPVEGAAMDITFSGIRPGEKLYEELVYEFETLEPTRISGVRSWPGEVVDASTGDAIKSQAVGLKGVREAGRVLDMIRSWVPELPITEQDAYESGRSGPLAA